MSSWLPRWLPFAVFAPLGIHFFETFPNGWDPAEYAWCVEAGYLPHSPYPLFLFLGRALHLLLPAPAALSALSLVGALAALAAIAWLVRETAPCPAGAAEARWRAASVATLVAVSPIFVLHAVTQEVYALQLAAVAGSAVIAVSRMHRKHLLSGAAFGAAVAIHNGSVFLLPALAFLVASRIGTRSHRLRTLCIWGGAAAAVLLSNYAVVAWLLPAGLGELLSYLRGLPPALDLAPLSQPGHAVEATTGLLARLTDGSLPRSHGPQATGSTGLSWLALVAAAAGFVVLALRNRTVAGFWGLWALPFAVYEIALGWNLDYGVYLVFLLPPLVVLAAEAAWWSVTRAPGWGRGVTAVALVALAVPSLSQLVSHWPDPRTDRLRHDSVATLAAHWAADSLPEEAVVIQPRSEWNANLLPLYAKRTHVARTGSGLRLFESRGRWTPMRPDAYATLSTARLASLLAEGTPVFAFERDPLRASATPGLDPDTFTWARVAQVDLEQVALGVGALAPERFAGRQLAVYTASLASESASTNAR